MKAIEDRNTMTMPGFTGEASLYRTSAKYVQSAGTMSAGNAPKIRPAQFVPMSPHRAAPLRKRDQDCVNDCMKAQGICMGACRLGGLHPVAWAACSAGCAAAGSLCAKNCYPLFPDFDVPL